MIDLCGINCKPLDESMEGSKGSHDHILIFYDRLGPDCWFTKKMFSGNQWPSTVGDRGKNGIFPVNNTVNGKRDSVYCPEGYVVELREFVNKLVEESKCLALTQWN